MNPLVSVLIPIYNTEKYLRQCLDSVVGQTYKQLEIICLNDASTDGSWVIAQEYAKRDERVVLIDKRVNGGYGSLINLGLERARGSYIAIVESDDWADTGMIQTLIENAIHYPQVDIVRGDYYVYRPSAGIDKAARNIPLGLANRPICPQVEQDVFKTHFAVWSAIYKRDFLQKNCIRLNDTPRCFYQDTSFTIITWTLAQYVYLTPVPVLHYRRDNPSSSVHQITHIFDIQQEFAYVKDFLATRCQPVQAVINHLKLRCYWWNIKRIPIDAACDFIEKCAPEIRHLVVREPVDWKGLSLRVRLRSYLWAMCPHILVLFWRRHYRR